MVASMRVPAVGSGHGECTGAGGMLAKVHSAALHGLQGLLVTVEVEAAPALPAWTTVGLPHRAVSEGKLRVRAAIEHCGIELPPRRVVVSLAPADVRKDGAAYDLPIALALLNALGRVELGRLAGFLILGELGLDGSLNAIRGALPLALAACRLGMRGVLVPRANAAEASVAGVEVLAASHLGDLLAWFQGGRELQRARPPSESDRRDVRACVEELADVRGQRKAVEAMEIAAAGGHSVLLAGPPGCGKTMLARRLPAILPPMSQPEALETSAIHSVAGILDADTALLRERPFRAPHHTASDVSLVGGGRDALPGEVSLAHNGVLFLDELPEFRRQSLEALRQPLEDGCVHIARARSRVRYPCRTMLVAAMNLCPCGGAGDSATDCRCSPASRTRYRDRLSAALLDRIDLQISLPPVSPVELSASFSAPRPASRNQVVCDRVAAARQRQREHFGPDGATCNAQMNAEELMRWCIPDPPARALLSRELKRLRLTARSHQRLLRVMRTIADLDGSEVVRAEAVERALEMRSLERAWNATHTM